MDADIANLVRTVYQHFVKPRISSSRSRLDRMTQALVEDLKLGTITMEEYKILMDRLGTLQKLRKNAEMVILLAEKLI